MNLQKECTVLLWLNVIPKRLAHILQTVLYSSLRVLSDCLKFFLSSCWHLLSAVLYCINSFSPLVDIYLMLWGVFFHVFFFIYILILCILPLSLERAQRVTLICMNHFLFSRGGQQEFKHISTPIHFNVSTFFSFLSYPFECRLRIPVWKSC